MLSTVAKPKKPASKPAKPAEPTEPAGLVQINLRLPPELLAAVDERVDGMNAADPWHRVNRSDFIREAIVRAIRSVE